MIRRRCCHRCSDETLNRINYRTQVVNMLWKSQSNMLWTSKSLQSETGTDNGQSTRRSLPYFWILRLMSWHRRVFADDGCILTRTFQIKSKSNLYPTIIAICYSYKMKQLQCVTITIYYSRIICYSYNNYVTRTSCGKGLPLLCLLSTRHSAD